MEPARTHGTSTAHRRQKQIENCLYENLLHTPYQSVSISDICRQVGISRKAFYNYYHDKDACLCALINRKIRDSILYATTATPDDASPLDAAVILLDYWKGEKVFLDVLIRNNLFHFLMLENIRYVLEEDRSTLDLISTPDLPSDTDILACYMSSQITLLLQWYYRDFDTPTEEMAKKLLRLLHVPLIVPSRKTE